MLEPHTASLLVDYYETFLRDHDLPAFRLNVAARYTEGTLLRLVESGTPPARRAAVLSLGLTGTMRVNDALGKALRDEDPSVRKLAQNALWAIWFRADSPENNVALLEIQELTSGGKPDAAVAAATKLIGRAPQFAEAYNMRAIAHFTQRRFVESAADCRRVLERNPCHFGALGGLGQCYLQLDDRAEALKVFRRALKLQPYNDGLRDAVAALEGNLRE